MLLETRYLYGFASIKGVKLLSNCVSVIVVSIVGRWAASGPRVIVHCDCVELHVPSVFHGDRVKVVICSHTVVVVCTCCKLVTAANSIVILVQFDLVVSLLFADVERVVVFAATGALG